MVYLLFAILFIVYGQLVLKWRVGLAGQLPYGVIDKLYFLLKMLVDPWVLSGFLAAFLASLLWMATITRLPLSYAYPYTGLVFVLLMIFSAVFFHEPLTWQKILGTGLVVLGIVVVSQG